MPQRAIRSELLTAFILALVLVAIVGCGRAPATKGPSAGTKVKLAAEGEPVVELVIDYGDGLEKKFSRIPAGDGMSVLGALELAARHPRGISIKVSGSGSSALLTQIDDLGNEAGRDGKNWLYRVNGKLADKSCDAYVLSPGDVILWKFEKYE